MAATTSQVPPTGASRTHFSFPAKYTGDQYIANGDYLLNSKNTLAARYLFSEDPQTVPFGIAACLAPRPAAYYANTNSTLKLTTIVTNSFVNEAHAAFQRNIANGSDSTPVHAQSIGQTHDHSPQTQPPVMIILGAVSIGGTLSPFYGPATQINFGDEFRGRTESIHFAPARNLKPISGISPLSLWPVAS